MTQKEFKKELISEFCLNEDAFRCYTVESYPAIKVILFKKKGCDKCYIGLLINNNFHVLGLGPFSCMDKDAKPLYVVLTGSLPTDEIILKSHNYIIFDDEEQKNIISKLNQIFSKS